MRYPLAHWRPGPVEKQGYAGLTWNACRGVVCHSAVGNLASAFGELDNIARRASWHFTIAQTGAVYQHYETTAVCWHAGSPPPNGLYIGIEHEGGAFPNFSEPFTLPQLVASVALVTWLSEQHGFALTRHAGLFEHNEFASTECPSGRVPWPAYTEGAMTQADKDEIVQRVNNHTDMKLLQLIVFLVNTGVKCKP